MTLKELRELSKDLPDTTTLEIMKGQRFYTVGEIEAYQGKTLILEAKDEIE